MHRLLRLSFTREPRAATENAWFSAKEALSELTSFADDVELAWRSEVERGAADIPLELRYALMRGTMHAQTAQVPDALIIALVERGVWPAEQGLSQAWRHADDTPGGTRARASLLAAMLRHLDSEQRSAHFTAVHELARRLGNGRAEVLWELVPAAPDVAREPLVEEALEATRQGGPQVVAEVLPRVPPPARRLLWPDLAKTFGDLPPIFLKRKLQEQALSAIESQLTTTEIEQAIALTREMPRGAQGPAVALLAMHLPEERRMAIAGEELAAAAGGEPTSEWADRLTALCPMLPAAWSDAALDAVARITDISRRAMTLAVLVKALDRHNPRRARVISQAITVSRNHGNKLWHARLMAMLARACPEHESAAMWQEALAAARGLKGDSFLTALRWIAPYVDAAEAEGFLEAARSVRRSHDLVDLLQVAAANLPPDQRTALLREALRTTDSAESGSADVALVIERLAAQLPDELIDEGFGRAERIGKSMWRQRALAALAPYLDSTQLRRALAAARAISDGVDATYAVLAIAAVDSAASRGIWELARSLADAIREPEGRASAFTQLARAAQEPERTAVLAEAQSAARRIASPYERCDALTELAGDLAGQPRHTTLAGALDAIRHQDAGGNLDDKLRQVAQLMPPDLLAEALQFARGLDSSFRAHAIAALVPFLPAELRAAACEDALHTGTGRFENAGDMHKLILNLAPYLPPQMTPYAISAISGIGQYEEMWRQDALLSLAPRLTEAERRKVLSDAELDTFRRRERSTELKTRVDITVAVSRGEVTASRTVVSLSRLWLHAVTSFRLPGVR